MFVCVFLVYVCVFSVCVCLFVCFVYVCMFVQVHPGQINCAACPFHDMSLPINVCVCVLCILLFVCVHLCRCRCSPALTRHVCPPINAATASQT